MVYMMHFDLGAGSLQHDDEDDDDDENKQSVP
jgi:hypothetical protein